MPDPGPAAGLYPASIRSDGAIGRNSDVAEDNGEFNVVRGFASKNAPGPIERFCNVNGMDELAAAAHFEPKARKKRRLG